MPASPRTCRGPRSRPGAPPVSPRPSPAHSRGRPRPPGPVPRAEPGAMQAIKSGKLLFNHPQGTHDDRFWAAALAVYSITEKRMNKPIADETATSSD